MSPTDSPSDDSAVRTPAASGSPYCLSNGDLEILGAVGIPEEGARVQLERVRRGSRYLQLDRPATVGDGIEVLDPELAEERAAAFRRGLPDTTRFVPASGAASRMFRDLLAKLEERGSAVCEQGSFFDQPWPFQKAIERCRRSASSQADQLRELLLGEDGLAQRPKALLPFHRHREDERTAFEEQVREAVELARIGESASVRLHFTCSPEHRAGFEEAESRVRRELADELSTIDLTIHYSEQHPATDTLALDDNDCPLRDDDAGELVLRPGGHGSLLRNLADERHDLVLVKNIDNVQPESQRATTLHWRASLLGALVRARDDVFEMIEALDAPTPAAIERARSVLRRLGRRPGDGSQWSEPAHLQRELDRPLRLCGVVLNEGEPGGGPFWVRDRRGETTLQIVEGAQVDPGDHDQQAILAAATHFNPVDLACSLRDRNGDLYDLERFRDDEAFLVASKSHGGRPIRALEHPGLWNGSMAHWLTLFVEAPPSTFTPVKTVWDLIRPEHQG